MEFGKKMMKQFNLDTNYTHLNHGSWGSTPNEILNFRINKIKEQERLPENFFRREIYEQHKDNCKQIAEFVGTTQENICLIDNTTHGINSCLISAPFSPDGDIVLVQSFTYKATKNAAVYIGQIRNFTVQTLSINFSKDLLITQDMIVDLYENELKTNTRIKLVILDYISSAVPILWPVERICNLCKQYNVLVLIDGAHSPGQVVDLNLDKLKPDYFVASLHKWNYVPRSCGLLYVAPQHQPTMRNIITGHYFMNEDYRKQFQHFGTREHSSLFCWKESRNFVEKCGGLTTISEYNSKLVHSAAKMLAKTWNTCQLPVDDDLKAPFMALIQVPTLKDYPIPKDNGEVFRDFNLLINDFLHKYNIAVPIFIVYGKVWLRISGQIYNEMSDYEKLSEAVLKLTH